MNSTTVNEHWIEVKHRLIPKNAHYRQIIESKRMFYSGIAVMYNLILSTAHLGESELADFFNNVDIELHDFFNKEIYQQETDYKRHGH